MAFQLNFGSGTLGGTRVDMFTGVSSISGSDRVSCALLNLLPQRSPGISAEFGAHPRVHVSGIVKCIMASAFTHVKDDARLQLGESGTHGGGHGMKVVLRLGAAQTAIWVEHNAEGRFIFSHCGMCTRSAIITEKRGGGCCDDGLGREMLPAPHSMPGDPVSN